MCQHLVYRYVSMMRGCLVFLIYQKTTSMSMVAAEDAAAVTLMSTDIERIINGMSKIHESWSTLLQMAVALALLYRQLGIVFVVPLGLFLRKSSSSPPSNTCIAHQLIMSMVSLRGWCRLLVRLSRDIPGILDEGNRKESL